MQLLFVRQIFMTGKLMKIGFIGLGNVGGKLSGSLLRNNVNLYVRDLDLDLVQTFVDRGAGTAKLTKI